MQVKAISKNVRVSPHKVRLVVNEIKKMPPREAVKMLDFIHKSSSQPLKKVVLSAIANAKNNYELDEQSLKFHQIQVGHGITFKRFRPISRGRPHQILKRTSNIRVELEGSKKVKNVTKVNSDSNDKKIKDNKGGTSGSKS